MTFVILDYEEFIGVFSGLCFQRFAPFLPSAAVDSLLGSPLGFAIPLPNMSFFTSINRGCLRLISRYTKLQRTNTTSISIYLCLSEDALQLRNYNSILGRRIFREVVKAHILDYYS